MDIQETAGEQTGFQARNSSQWSTPAIGLQPMANHGSRRPICSAWFLLCFRRLELLRSELVMKGASASRTFHASPAVHHIIIAPQRKEPKREAMRQKGLFLKMERAWLTMKRLHEPLKANAFHTPQSVRNQERRLRCAEPTMSESSLPTQ